MEQEKDLIIEKENSSYLRIYAKDDDMLEDIYQYFKYKKPDFKKSPWQKSKWDGTVRLFDKRKKRLPYGLLNILLELCKVRKYTFEIDPAIIKSKVNISDEEIDTFIESLKLTDKNGNEIIPYSYQRQAFADAIRYRRFTGLAATSAGKSLIQYLIVRWFEYVEEDDIKILLLVPSINLVDQMFGDFKDYSSANKWNTAGKCHKIVGGAKKFTNKPIIISTWQSLQGNKVPDDYFLDFDVMLCDEAHLASGDSISEIMTKGLNADVRIALTGTLRKDQLHPLQVQSHFGPIKTFVTSKELRDNGQAAKTNITMLVIDHTQEDREAVAGMNYQEEIEFMMGHEFRNAVIEKMFDQLPGNSLFLFERVSKHLEVFVERLNARTDLKKKFFVIDGKVSGDERTDIKQAIENGDDIVLLASYGTLAVGVSIKKLHNLVFCHPSKSVIRVLQSIGRLMRLHGSKDIAQIIDICDNMQIEGQEPNRLLDWALKRWDFYKEDEHPVTVRRLQAR